MYETVIIILLNSLKKNKVIIATSQSGQFFVIFKRIPKII